MFINWIIDILQDNSNLLTAIALVVTLSEKAYDLCSSALDFEKKKYTQSKSISMLKYGTV